MELELGIPARTQSVREERVTFEWRGGDGPEFTMVHGYGKQKGDEFPVRLTSVYARYSPEGELLSAKATAKRVKKDGTLGMNTAYLPYTWERENLTQPLNEWWRAHRGG